MIMSCDARWKARARLIGECGIMDSHSCLWSVRRGWCCMVW